VSSRGGIHIREHPLGGPVPVESALDVDKNALEVLLRSIQDGSLSAEEGVGSVLDAIGRAGQLDLGHTRLDTDRADRCGHAEVVYGEGKSPDELVEICGALLEAHGRFLATRVQPAGRAALSRAMEVQVDDRAATVTGGALPEATGDVAIISAGTSDAPVAREAATTARFLGAAVEQIPDVGVAGIHRILSVAPRIREANVIIVVASMEGALPGVVGGIVGRPVIAVPTSVGYGASLGGVAALLGMLNSCASGITVVNIDNGFGAGFAAAQINRQIVRAAQNGRSRTS